MITSRRFPYLRVVLTIDDVTLEVDCYLDTGFDGYLIVPAAFGEQRGPGDFVSRWGLGDATTVAADSYLGSVRLTEFNLDFRS